MKRRNILLALALTLPVVLFFLAHAYNHDRKLRPTGFIQYDNVSYIAYARQYLDQEGTHFQYSNPFNDDDSYKPVYFQPQTIMFALLLKLGIPPGFILPFFTIICCFISFRLLIAIYDHVSNSSANRVLNLWLFAWGGGLLVLAGIIYHYLVSPGTALSNDYFKIDPEGGWWGLNFGRSLLFTCEAYYHALFIGCIYCLLKQKWIIALSLTFALSLSHPFTGIELALIVLGWFMFEFLYKQSRPPLWFGITALMIVIFHLYYYLLYLPRFEDHKSVSEQYSLTWGLRYYRMIPAYCIVGALAIGAFFMKPARKLLDRPHNRLFLSWFFVAFLLVNHDLFMAPKQPIHFTRGYVWTSLFLLGLPALQYLVSYLKARRLIVLFVVTFLFDNFWWLTIKIYSRPSGTSTGYVTEDQEKVWRILQKESTNRTLLISSNENISYLATVYSKAYPLYSHPFTTPFAAKKRAMHRKFFNSGILDSSLQKRDIIFVLQPNDTIALRTIRSLNVEQLPSSNTYQLFHYFPK